MPKPKAKGLMRQLLGGDLGEDINELLSEGKGALKASKEDLPKLKAQMDFIEDTLIAFILVQIGNLSDEDKLNLRKDLIDRIQLRVIDSGKDRNAI